MPSYSKDKLSGSTDGRGVLITGTLASGATTIHTSATGTGADRYDEVYLYAVNTSTAARKLTIMFGASGVRDQIEHTIFAKPDGMSPILPGLLLQNAKTVKAFAAVASVLTVHGYVNKVRP